MKKKLIIVLAAAMLLTACNNESEEISRTTELITLPSEESTPKQEPAVTQGSDLPDLSEEGTTAETTETETPQSEPVTKETEPQTDAPQSEETTPTTEPSGTSAEESVLTEQSAASETTDVSVQEEHIPDTYQVELDGNNVGRMEYYTQYIGTSATSPYSLTNAVYIMQMTDIFNGLIYEEIPSDELEKEAQAYALWQQEKGGKIQPEALIIYDKKGGELVRFYSDAKSALPSGGGADHFSRALVNGKEYRLLQGSPDYRTIQETLLNQQLISRGYFFLEVYLNVAKNAVRDLSEQLTDDEPSFRVHSPEEAMTLPDGTVLYPESFAADTVLVDCIFNYADGGTLTVTMNAADAEVYQIKSQH